MNAFRYNKCAWTFSFCQKTKRKSVFLSQYINMFHVKPFCLKGNRLRSVGLARYSQYNAVQIYIIFIWRRTWGSALVLYENINIFWSRNAREPVCRAERMPEIIDRRFVWGKTAVCREKLRLNSGGKHFSLMHSFISCISFLKRILVLACKARYAVALLLFLVSFWNREAWLRNSICYSERMED